MCNLHFPENLARRATKSSLLNRLQGHRRSTGSQSVRSGSASSVPYARKAKCAQTRPWSNQVYRAWSLPGQRPRGARIPSRASESLPDAPDNEKDPSDDTPVELRRSYLLDSNPAVISYSSAHPVSSPAATAETAAVIFSCRGATATRQSLFDHFRGRARRTRCPKDACPAVRTVEQLLEQRLAVSGPRPGTACPPPGNPRRDGVLVTTRRSV